MRWITSDIVELLSSPEWGIETCPPGGDYDTENIVITPQNCNENLRISGFDTNNPCKNPSDSDISMIEVSDDLDSSGGLNSSNTKICEVYGEVCARLKRRGFTIVPNMKPYF